jgi:hypothetical protein
MFNDRRYLAQVHVTSARCDAIHVFCIKNPLGDAIHVFCIKNPLGDVGGMRKEL